MHFSSVEQLVGEGDLVYFDPPFVPTSQTANFTSYSHGGFSMEDQEDLAALFERLAGAGARVLLSNADVPWVHERYGDFQIRTIRARRSVNVDGGGRGKVGEVIVSNV
jgi:DNA adenine methylase